MGVSFHKLRVNLMTAGLTPGDAVSNYVFSLGRVWRRWGATVNIYADHIAPQLQTLAQPSDTYRPTGQDLLWFHYSIYADNVRAALGSPDWKVMDYHGICPPRLFAGQNAHLEYLCQSGIELLPSLADGFDQYLTHTEYTREELKGLGFPADRLRKIAYCVETGILGAADDADLSARLSKLTYFLLVGRIVPQKDVLALLEIFAHVHRRRPDIVLILVGSRQQTKQYQGQLDAAVAANGLTDRVIFAEQVNNPAVLASLYRHAALLFVTSEWESFCVPIAESLYFGVPAAVHQGPPMPEVAGPGGVVFDKRRPAAAADQVLALLDDRPRYEALKAEAVRWSRQYTDQALERNMLRLLTEWFDLKDVNPKVGRQ